MQDSATPAPGQQVITPCAFIHRSFDGVDKLFLPKRADTKKFLPGSYELPGGHVDFGEDIVAALKREIMEEFGMRINVGDPFFVFTYMNEVKGAQGIEVVYFASFEDPVENIKTFPEEHSGFKWASEDEFEGVFTQTKPADDPEIAAAKKGFALLRGEKLLF
jgi:8-oxo-dGTP diphosphatase